MERMLDSLKSVFRYLMVAAVLFPFSAALAASPFLGNAEGWKEPIQARFDPTSRKTQVVGRVASNLCFSFALPQEWQSKNGGMDARLKSSASTAELEVSLRSAHELQGMPQSDLASRDAAFLQQDYENLLGRPAQSVRFTSLETGAMRWSATWIDGNLPVGPQGMTVEAFIIPLSNDWLLELSVTNAERREHYEGIIQALLAGLRVQRGQSCGD